MRVRSRCRGRWFWRALSLGALIGLLPSSAQAIPAFARKYDVSCHTCHAMVFPELNPFGRRFKENGYQFPKGAEEAYVAGASDRPSSAERLDLLRVVPVALRGRVEADVTADRTPSSVTNASFYVPTKLQLLIGGALFQNISFFGAVNFLPLPQVTTLTIGVHDLFLDPGVSIQIGRFTVADFMRPGERAYTLVSNPAAQVQVGADPFALDSPNDGLRLWIRPLDGPVFIEMAAVQSAGIGLTTDLLPTVWARVEGDLGPHRISAFGVWGRTDLAFLTGVPGFTNEHAIAGAEAEAALPWGSLYGYGLLGHDTNPYEYAGKPATYYGARAEFDYTGITWMVAAVRWDWVWSPDDATLFRNQLAAHLSILIATNVKFLLEGRVGLGHATAVAGSLGLEVAF